MKNCLLEFPKKQLFFCPFGVYNPSAFRPIKGSKRKRLYSFKPVASNSFSSNFGKRKGVKLTVITEIINFDETLNIHPVSQKHEGFKNCCFCPFSVFSQKLTIFFSFHNKTSFETILGHNFTPFQRTRNL